jgi:glutamate synthase domain-containing protein 1
MEHEQINDKCVAISMRGTKATGRLLAQAMQAFLKKASQLHIKHGKQSLKSLSKRGNALADIEITGDNIGTFKKTARKFKIDYSLKKDSSQDPPRWVVFFEARNDKALQSAFNEYAKVTLKQKAKKVPLLEKLKRNKDRAHADPDKVIERVKNKSKSAER